MADRISSYNTPFSNITSVQEVNENTPAEAKSEALLEGDIRGQRLTVHFPLSEAKPEAIQEEGEGASISSFTSHHQDVSSAVNLEGSVLHFGLSQADDKAVPQQPLTPFKEEPQVGRSPVTEVQTSSSSSAAPLSRQARITQRLQQLREKPLEKAVPDQVLRQIRSKSQELLNAYVAQYQTVNPAGIADRDALQAHIHQHEAIISTEALWRALPYEGVELLNERVTAITAQITHTITEASTRLEERRNQVHQNALRELGALPPVYDMTRHLPEITNQSTLIKNRVIALESRQLTRQWVNNYGEIRAFIGVLMNRVEETSTRITPHQEEMHRAMFQLTDQLARVTASFVRPLVTEEGNARLAETSVHGYDSLVSFRTLFAQMDDDGRPEPTSVVEVHNPTEVTHLITTFINEVRAALEASDDAMAAALNS